jgi:hypothetical protein
MSSTNATVLSHVSSEGLKTLPALNLTLEQVICTYRENLTKKNEEKESLACKSRKMSVQISSSNLSLAEPECIPDGNFFEWVVMKLEVPQNFEYGTEKCVGVPIGIARKKEVKDELNEYYLYIVRTKSMGVTASIDVDMMHDATKVIVRGLTISWLERGECVLL